ncbi:alpha/beta fold hydrolase [Spirosoma rhododendri]|uniref:Alpha/beta hydrolase n=1 Tax=Spirosoma rhododendri TaxID=2728024 RepID=A0A7L5DG40_9BACT|nr:alpha/beta hydrolase [Spirosoma rhododendri]QJD77176.1 alpha/beta hydrolase [Spirosoma rhododendri]
MNKKIFVSLALTLLSFAWANGQAPARTANGKPTVVFVHGLWADGSSWSKVIAPLLASGYPVISVQNPTTSLEDDVAATKRAIARAEGDVVLVGHSWGGFVISEAGNDPKVKALVYVAALMPDNGETIPSLSAKAAATKLGTFLKPADGFLTLSKEGVMQAFAGDVSKAEQELIFATQPPASESVFKAEASNVAWKQKPSWYIVATKDGAINPDLERMMAKRGNAKTTEISASHVPMVSKPAEVLKVVKEAADSVK